ncbi:MAG: ABC transporter substrate-binding protein [Candidatus Thorarchaeota archaeon]
MAIKKRAIAAIWVGVIIFMAISPGLTIDAQDVQSDIRIGPYIDKVVLKFIQDKDQAVLALQSNAIDLIGDWIWPEHLVELEGNPDISVYSALRYGYGHFTINCGKYPLNISGFRRAFAYAFDKARFRTEVLVGYSELHDSVIPCVNEFYCIEDQLPYHYYIAQPELGNQILDDLGFDIHPMTGYRTAPDGSPFKVVIKYSASSEVVAGSAARYGVDALNSLHIDAESVGTGFFNLIGDLDHHRDYDIAFYATHFYQSDVLWLEGYDSQYVDVPFQNEVNFANSTYDTWCDVLRSAMTYEQAYEAAEAMQLILHENVARFVVYENIYTQPYRNDVFTGHVGDKSRYLHGEWTFRNIHKIDGTSGGTVRMSYDLPLYTLNPFLKGLGVISDLVWPSLYSLGPNQELLPNVAESLLMETHADNPKVYEGNTRFTVDLIQNATWSDGTPLTALDVANTYSYIYGSASFGNTEATSIFGDLVAAYAPSPYKAVIEFNTESMWHLTGFSLASIIPKHIFNDVDGIGYDGWNKWNPGFDPAVPYITAGPFELTDLQAGDFFEFSANPDFWYRPQNLRNGTETTPTTPTSFNSTLAITAGAVGAASTILVGGFFMFKRETI